MFQLGKIMNPVTGKIEKDLNGARASIEMLRMLQAKTEGNLSDKENGALEDALSNMQMNYVEEVKREGEKPEEKKESEKPKAKTEKSEPTKTEAKKTTDGRNSKSRIIVP